ncbi:uncharacterized protein IWZ02DRAFT_178966 [Phyllosticta citriasiana]|uniref:uncharacterized protein n=1 Tax=Phyllosticta citriasiana TaxID=595635 RepID=UPI0030FDDEF3
MAIEWLLKRGQRKDQTLRPSRVRLLSFLSAGIFLSPSTPVHVAAFQWLQERGIKQKPVSLIETIPHTLPTASKTLSIPWLASLGHGNPSNIRKKKKKKKKKGRPRHMCCTLQCADPRDDYRHATDEQVAKGTRLKSAKVTQGAPGENGLLWCVWASREDPGRMRRLVLYYSADGVWDAGGGGGGVDKQASHGAANMPDESCFAQQQQQQE